jgi:phosphate transport system substrate-binding protein
VIAYNLPDVKGELTLSVEVLAGICLGEISAWDDRRIASMNPGLHLPSIPIRVCPPQ